MRAASGHSVHNRRSVPTYCLSGSATIVFALGQRSLPACAAASGRICGRFLLVLLCWQSTVLPEMRSGDSSRSLPLKCCMLRRSSCQSNSSKQSFVKMLSLSRRSAARALPVLRAAAAHTDAAAASSKDEAMGFKPRCKGTRIQSAGAVDLGNRWGRKCGTRYQPSVHAAWSSTPESLLPVLQVEEGTPER